MLRNRLLFCKMIKTKSQARTAISRKPRAAHNISLCSKPKAKQPLFCQRCLSLLLVQLLLAVRFRPWLQITRMRKHTLTQKKMLKRTSTVIAHRGASGYLPEHTLEAATLAFSLGPDFIEQDVVITKDDIPVVLHDIHLETVTNVEDVFPARHRDDGRYYARDFTLEELRQLRVHERANSDGKQVFKDRYRGTHANFKVATLNEHFELISELTANLERLSVYPK